MKKYLCQGCGDPFNAERAQCPDCNDTLNVIPFDSDEYRRILEMRTAADALEDALLADLAAEKAEEFAVIFQNELFAPEEHPSVFELTIGRAGAQFMPQCFYILLPAARPLS
jgi:hypothetical protein